MKKGVFFRGFITTVIVGAILFLGVGMLANGDPLWFIHAFHPGVKSVKVYWDDGVYVLEAGDKGFDELSRAFVDGVAHFGGYEDLVVFSETNWQDYRERGRLLEVYYEDPVQVHTRYKFSKAATYLVPLNRTHAYYHRVFSLPGNAKFAVGSISMRESSFNTLVTAVEYAVVSAAGQALTEEEGALAGQQVDSLKDEDKSPEPTPTTEGTPVITPETAGMLKPDQDTFDDFLDQSYFALLVRDPEYVTELGLADVLGTGNDQLTDLSDAYIRETQALQKSIYYQLLAYNRQDLQPDQQLSYDIYKWYLEDLIQSHAYMYNDYPLNQFILSVHNSTIHFFTEIHPVTSYKLAEDYITRLSQVNQKFLGVLDGLKIREQRGVILPRFLIQWTLRDLKSMASTSAEFTPFYQNFAQKVDQLEGVSIGEKEVLLANAKAAISDSVLPGYKALADYFTYLLPLATNDAGAWKLPDGDAYYAAMLNHFTTTSLTAEEIHQLGLREVERLQFEIRSQFLALGYLEDASLPVLYERLAQDGGVYSGEQILHGYENIINTANGRLRDSFDLLPSTDVVVLPDEIGGYYVPPARDGSRPGAFYASVRGSTPKFTMPTLAYHEAIPGHHFQLAIAQELDIPAFRQDSQFTVYTEGWALYAEYLAFELGFYEDDPYGNLGRLQGEMFRAVRLVVDTGIHAMGWTFDQAVSVHAGTYRATAGDGGISNSPLHRLARTGSVV